MSMISGRTSAQIVADVLAVLQASAEITAVVPLAQIVHSRTAPQPDDKIPALILYCHAERENSTGYCQQPMASVVTDLAVEYYATAANDAALEVALDFTDTVKDVLYADQSFLRSFESLETTTLQRQTGSDGAKRIGVGRLLIGIKHTRMWS